MKIAFLFLTLADMKCEGMWKTFLKGHEDSYTIYNHPKFPERVTPHSILKNHITPTTIPTQWAHLSLVKATILMMKEALLDADNQWFLLCSDSCIPIVDFKTIYEFLKGHDKTFFCYNAEYSKTKDSEKRYFRFQNKSLIPHKHFMKADQWFMMTRQGAEICAQSPHIHDFDRVFASDEHYFINILRLYKIPFQNRWTTYTDHEIERTHALTFFEVSHRFLYYLQTQGFFFLRKVAHPLRFID
jgi:hypothetical protein